MAASTARPYLRSDARRRQLLDAAARLFAREGYAGLSMVALAAEAGVSRRLVYDHFPDLAALYDEYFDDRARRYLTAIDEALAAAGNDPVRALPGAFTQLLAMPVADRRAVQALVADPGHPALNPVRERFRSHVEARWLAATTGPDDERIRARLWMVVGGLFALADLVARDELRAATATDLVRELVPVPA